MDWRLQVGHTKGVRGMRRTRARAQAVAAQQPQNRCVALLPCHQIGIVHSGMQELRAWVDGPLLALVSSATVLWVSGAREGAAAAVEEAEGHGCSLITPTFF